jgi:hypothetical protein
MTDSHSKLCGDMGSTRRARRAGASDGGSTAPVIAEVRAGDGGGAARGRAFKSEATQATAAVEAGARDGGGAVRGRAKAEARASDGGDAARGRATVEASATVKIEHPLEPTLLPSVPISLWRTQIWE